MPKGNPAGYAKPRPRRNPRRKTPATPKSGTRGIPPALEMHPRRKTPATPKSGTRKPRPVPKPKPRPVPKPKPRPGSLNTGQVGRPRPRPTVDERMEMDMRRDMQERGKKELKRSLRKKKGTMV